MVDAKKNTVPSSNQMINSDTLSFLGDPNAPLKILVVGNSITRHGPKAEIGWEYDWGMAASAPEKDYVHRLYEMLKESGKDVYMMICQASSWEIGFWREDILDTFKVQRDFAADIVVLRLGENVSPENECRFKDYLGGYIDYICPKGARTVFTTCFWPKPVLDTAIRELAAARGDECADIACTDDKFMALGKFEHSGVAMHPGDEGMEFIAKAIFEKI